MKRGISSQLKIISLLPITLLFMMAAYYLYTAYSSYNEISRLQDRITLNQELGTLMTQIGKERGMSATYIGSGGNRVKDSIAGQRKVVDKQIARLQHYLASRPSDKKALQDLMDTLAQINGVRQKIDTLQISFDDAFFGYYTNTLNKKISNEIAKISSLSAVDAETSSLVTALITLDQIKEYSGIERDYIAFALARYTELSDAEVTMWNTMMSKASILNTSMILSHNGQAQLDALFSTPKNKEIFDEVMQERIDIQRAMNDGMFPVDTTLWFNVNSSKIKVLAEAQKELSKLLMEKTEAMKVERVQTLTIASLILLLSTALAIFGFTISRALTANIKGLEGILRQAAASEFLQKFQDDGEVFTAKAKLSPTGDHNEGRINQEAINLDTSDGIREAYYFLEKTIDIAQSAIRKAEEASTTKSLFLANMSHELRTPLNGIIGFTELLKGTELNEEQNEFIEIIIKSSESLLEIINSILDLSKVESNKIEIENIVFNPIEEFEAAIEVYATRAAEKNINLGLFIDPALPQSVKGDPTKIKEVLVNLVSNAVKFTPANGSVTVEVRSIEKLETTRRILFSVSDTGVGISADKKAHIFDPFTQADASVTRKHGGTGLGLTISHKFIELMGGNIELESELGKGSRFYFTLELDEIQNLSETFEGTFAHYNVGILGRADAMKKQTRFLDEYLTYFGAHHVMYTDVKVLAASEQLHDMIIVDFDYITKEDLVSLCGGAVPVALIAKVRHQKTIDDLDLPLLKLTYEPINGTKVRNLLIACRQSVKTVTSAPKAVDWAHATVNAKILVAEDNPINQKLIKKTLEDLGLTVTLAANGLEAFEQRKNANYDLIFMDIQMPIMDGIEAAQEIMDYETDYKQHHVPIIALTANALKGDRERFMAAGMDEYTTKPLVRSDILALLARFLAEKISVSTESDNEAYSDDIPASPVSSAPQIVLPEAKTSAVPTPELAPQSTDVLIVKQSEIEGTIFADALANLGHHADVVTSLAEALDHLAQGNYAVCMIDREMDTDPALKRIADSRKISVVAFIDPGTTPDPQIRDAYSEIMKNQLNQDLLRLIMEKFIKNEG